jgi:flagellar assembly protein FliH
MANAARFLFDRDFRNPAPDQKQAAAMADAEARGYMRGLADGQRQAEAEAQARLADAQARLADALSRLAAAAGTLLETLDAHQAETERVSLDLALTLARKLAGEALARDPLGPIGEAAAQAFQHLRGVPHLVVRVNDALVEAVDALVHRMARERGFDGRLVTLGDPTLPPGDARLEWADGGVVRDQARIEQAVAAALGL